MKRTAYPFAITYLAFALSATAAAATTLNGRIHLHDKRVQTTLIAEPGSMQELLEDTSTDPYTSFQQFGMEMLTLLTNPMNVSVFEERLRRKGVQDMGVPVVNLFEEEDAWVVQFGSNPGGGPENGLFCRVSKDDTESINRMRQIVLGVGFIEITAALGEFELDAEVPMMRIVLEPCRIAAVRHR